MTISAGSTILASDLDRSAGISTKDTSSSTTTTIAHGLSFAPRRVRIVAVYAASDGKQECFTEAVYINGSTYGLSKFVFDNVSGAGSGSITQTFRLRASSDSHWLEGVISVDSTNISITWTPNGTPTGTFNLVWEASN